MLNDQIEKYFLEAISSAIESKSLGKLREVPKSLVVELCKNPEHGDRAISIAMKLTKEAGLKPRDIAQVIVDNLSPEALTKFSTIDIAGPGFINLRLNWDLLEESLSEIFIKGDYYGKLKSEERPDKSFSKVLIEYVSANPTGDLHIGHGRQAVLGSSLANLFHWAGYEVSSEFYINDAGVQMNKLAESAKAAILIQEALMDESEYSEDFYPLDSMLEFIKPKLYKTRFGNSVNFSEISLQDYQDFAKEIFLQVHKKILEEISVVFDTWYSEKDNLHREEDHKVKKVCSELQEKGFAYESEEALWFRAKDFGDERDRVLIKNDASYTYLAADYAYHEDKFSRGFDKLINVWGADHHGQEAGLRYGLQALGHKAEQLEIVFIQMVSLMRGKQEVKMSKRSGNIVNVRDVLEEVGADSLRYFLVESQANNRMIFDLELATKQDKDNPVYYIQYAHARCSSIVRTLLAEQLNAENLEAPQIDKPILSEEEFKLYLKEFEKTTKVLSILKTTEAEAERTFRLLTLHLSDFTTVIFDAALARAPYKIANYLRDLATLFHQFYFHNRVIVEDRELLKARLKIVLATKTVLKNALSILGISAPESM
jgi:arginyl-tRNA synthetase